MLGAPMKKGASSALSCPNDNANQAVTLTSVPVS